MFKIKDTTSLAWGIVVVALSSHCYDFDWCGCATNVDCLFNVHALEKCYTVSVSLVTYQVLNFDINNPVRKLFLYQRNQRKEEIRGEKKLWVISAPR